LNSRHELGEIRSTPTCRLAAPRRRSSACLPMRGLWLANRSPTLEWRVPSCFPGAPTATPSFVQVRQRYLQAHAIPCVLLCAIRQGSPTLVYLCVGVGRACRLRLEKGRTHVAVQQPRGRHPTKLAPTVQEPSSSDRKPLHASYVHVLHGQGLGEASPPGLSRHAGAFEATPQHRDGVVAQA